MQHRMFPKWPAPVHSPQLIIPIIHNNIPYIFTCIVQENSHAHIDKIFKKFSLPNETLINFNFSCLCQDNHTRFIFH
jgi:NADPH-dependent glutamate synthase beta subunit-like oxidoreductase